MAHADVTTTMALVIHRKARMNRNLLDEDPAADASRIYQRHLHRRAVDARGTPAKLSSTRQPCPVLQKRVTRLKEELMQPDDEVVSRPARLDEQCASMECVLRDLASREGDYLHGVGVRPCVVWEVAVAVSGPSRAATSTSGRTACTSAFVPKRLREAGADLGWHARPVWNAGA